VVGKATKNSAGKGKRGTVVVEGSKNPLCNILGH